MHNTVKDVPWLQSLKKTYFGFRALVLTEYQLLICENPHLYGLSIGDWLTAVSFSAVFSTRWSIFQNVSSDLQSTASLLT
jgi:hypothetical protein